MHSTSVEAAGNDNVRDRWAEETKRAIKFEEDPHSAALNDNPDEVFVGPRTWAAIFALSLSLAAPIGLSVVTLAPVSTQVTRELDAEQWRPWVVGSWSIANGCSAAIAGYLSDTFGRRNVIIAGDLIVIAGCILGGTASSIQILITAQTLNGFGAGFAFDAFAAVPEMLPNKWRALGAACVEGGINLPWATIAVVLGNAITRYASWRWIYYIAILISFISFKATVLCYWPVSRPQGDFHRTRRQQIKQLDYIGMFSLTAGIVLLTCGLTWGGSLYPWRHPGSILPIIIGFLTALAGFGYDLFWARNPMIPPNLFSPSMFRRYLAILIVLFVSGMNFYAMTSLLPLGSSLMFTTDGLEVGVMSLPNSTVQLIVGFCLPLVAHKIPRLLPALTIKWQLVLAMAMQTVFLALSVFSVNPNNKYAYMFLPSLGMPMFVWVTVLSYAISSLHVPHSQLGIAVGLLGTFRSTGGALGNALFGALFASLSARDTSASIQEACTGLDLCPNTTAFRSLLSQTIAYNQGTAGMLTGIAPEARDTLQKALRLGYGRSFQILFCATIPLSCFALVCSFFIEDPWPYMNNHIQFRMYEQGGFRLRSPDYPELTGATVRSNKRKMASDGDSVMTELERIHPDSSQTGLNTW